MKQKAWMLTVTVDGKEVLLLDPEFLDDHGIQENLDVIETCAYHLLAIIGKVPVEVEDEVEDE